MEFYDEKDLIYWRKQAELGKAVILEIPVSMLLDLDIRSLSRKRDQNVRVSDLEAWMEDNKDAIMAELSREAAQKDEVEMLCQNLYDKQAGKGETPGVPAQKVEAVPAKDNGEILAGTVAKIMSQEVFSDAQIEVIAEAMLEELPEKYMLCFLKKKYSPEIMRKLKDYCTKLYREEVSEGYAGR